ncbi:MAG TPA: hypothetical protein DEP87_02125 [Candidatus Pacebacteria bacterium]|nr:hypothetical protein [Candidatus Paceibacterota bacterium]
MTDSFDFDPIDSDLNLADLAELADQDSVDFDRVQPHHPAAQKFQLFVKVREIHQLSQLLQEVSLKTTRDRRTWVQENEVLISNLITEFTDDSLSQLQGIGTDQETVKLSMDLVSSLRQTLLLLDSLMIRTKSQSQPAILKPTLK